MIPVLLLKGDEIRLRDGQIVNVIDVWGVARCHAKVQSKNGEESLIIAEKDVDSIIRRPAIRKSLKI